MAKKIRTKADEHEAARQFLITEIAALLHKDWHKGVVSALQPVGLAGLYLLHGSIEHKLKELKGG